MAGRSFLDELLLRGREPVTPSCRRCGWTGERPLPVDEAREAFAAHGCIEAKPAARPRVRRSSR